MVKVSPPSQADTRSSLADWLELRTLMEAGGVATKSTLLNILDISEDDASERERFDSDTGESLDESILEGNRSQFVEIAFEELGYRHKLLGESYPFDVDMKKLRLVRRTEGNVDHPGQVVYLFCLLASAIRERKFQPKDDELSSVEKDIADAFQVCACLAAGGYLSGEVSSFGFPRATGSGFLAALRNTFARFGYGSVRENNNIPDGLPICLKDGGIDVVAWRDHPDGMPGKLYLLGQCASGLNWRDKSVVEYIEQLHGSWFTTRPATYHTPAMFIPFPFHHELEETKKGPFLEAVKNRFWYEESRFGVIFDRLRIVHFANLCVASATEYRKRVDGLERFDQVVNWVCSTRLAAGIAQI